MFRQLGGELVEYGHQLACWSICAVHFSSAGCAGTAISVASVS
jgi:hypothetical protein